jgi:hypothetical protein
MAIAITDQLPLQSYPWCDIFNTVAFYNLHKMPKSVYLSISDGDETIGCAHFTETEPGVFTSPYRGTYGGFDFKEGLSLENIEASVDLTINWLKAHHHAKTIVIKAPPSSHNPHISSLLFNTMLNKGFTIENHEIDFAILVDEMPLVYKMKRNNKKRFQKCEREGFEFAQETDPQKFEDIYKIIKQNRESKGYEVSMTFEQVMDMYRVFPDSIYFFKTGKGGENIAASICIRINNDVLYVFYWGDIPGYGEYSPIVFLASRIYGFAQYQGFTLIDGGTSSIYGRPNYGTAAFKENLGFEACLKLTYSRTNE